MGKVYVLPDLLQRQWRPYEKLLRSALLSEGNGPLETEYVISMMGPIFNRSNHYAFKNNLATGEPEYLINDLNQWVKCQMFLLMLEIAARDLELFDLRGAG